VTNNKYEDVNGESCKTIHCNFLLNITVMIKKKKKIQWGLMVAGKTGFDESRQNFMHVARHVIDYLDLLNSQHQ